MLPSPRNRISRIWILFWAALVVACALIAARPFLFAGDGEEKPNEDAVAVASGVDRDDGPGDVERCMDCPGGRSAGGDSDGGSSTDVVGPPAPSQSHTPGAIPTPSLPPATPAPTDPVSPPAPIPTPTPDVRQPPVIPPVPGDPVAIDLSFYVCTGAPIGYSDGYCGTAADGTQVYEGMVACGYAWALGTRFTIDGDPTGRTYVCHDRGLGPWHWLDVFFWTYADGRAWRDAVGYGAVIARVAE